MLSEILRGLVKIINVVFYNFIILMVVTAIWVSFDYGTYGACDRGNECFVSYLSEKIASFEELSHVP
jgi:hypothetical protein